MFLMFLWFLVLNLHMYGNGIRRRWRSEGWGALLADAEKARYKAG